MSSVSLMALCVRMKVSKPAESRRIEFREVKAMLGNCFSTGPVSLRMGEANDHAVLMSAVCACLNPMSLTMPVISDVVVSGFIHTFLCFKVHVKI